MVDYCYDGDMKTTTPLIRFVFSTALFTAATALVAQGPPGHDPHNPPPGHGGIPPGQAKKFEDDHDRGHGHDWDHDRDHERGHVPPGQAKKYDYPFAQRTGRDSTHTTARMWSVGAAGGGRSLLWDSRFRMNML